MLSFLVPRSVYCSRARITKGRRYLSVHGRRSQRQPVQLKSPVAANIAARTFADVAEEDEDSMEGSDELDGFGALDEADIARRQAEHNRWLVGEGAQYRRPKENGPNWLGGNIPFPMNPSFRPPVPISNGTRIQIYSDFLSGKTEQEIAADYGLGVSRVKAILRLKKLEQLWVKGRPCQHRLQSDMERYLGVRGEEKGRDRERANSIDMNVDAFPIGQSRRLQRVFFEVTEEGQPAPLASHLDQIEATLEEQAQETTKGRQTTSKGPYVLVPASTQAADGKQLRPATKFSWYYSSKPGRPPYTFVDIGDRYLNQGKKIVDPESLSTSSSTSISNPVAAKMAEEEKAKKRNEEIRAKRLVAQKALARKALALRRPLLVKEREELDRIFNAEAKIADARRKLLDRQKRAAELQKGIEKSTATLKNLRI